MAIVIVFLSMLFAIRKSISVSACKSKINGRLLGLKAMRTLMRTEPDLLTYNAPVHLLTESSVRE
jgi:hypothetical protein